MGTYFFDTSALVKRYVIEARNKLTSLGITTLTFVSADTELLSMANAEGLSIENPNLF